MGKRFTPAEIEILKKNPNVKDIRENRITFTFDFKHRLWKEWNNDRSTACIRRVLEENSFDCRMLGSLTIHNLNERLKRDGEPSGGKNKILGVNASTFKTNEADDRYLISTGVFVSGRRGIAFSEDFINEVYHSYPEKSVEEALEAHDIDPEMVGYQRIYQLKMKIEGNGTQNISFSYSNEFLSRYKDHPYVERCTYKQFSLNSCFYNEAQMFSSMHIDDILDIFEISHNELPVETRNRILHKLRNWKTTEETLSIADLSFRNRILENKEMALMKLISLNFSYISSAVPDMKKKDKKKLCLWIRDFPYESRKTFNVSSVLDKVRISRSGYYAILKNDRFGEYEEYLENRDDEDVKLIRLVLESEKYPMGYRTVYMKMYEITGVQFGISKVRRLMNHYHLNPEIRRGNQSRKSAQDLLKRNVKPNLLKRRFRFERPLTTFLSDVSYLRYGNNRTAYLSPVKDSTTGRIIGAEISETNDVKLGTDTLTFLENTDLNNDPIFHTDQGVIYLNDQFQNKLRSMGFRESMSRRGNCWDNASQESFFGHFKDECDYSQCENIDELRDVVYEYIDYYNNRRPQWTRNRMTPVQYEKYLNDMSDEEFASYQAQEKKKYDTMMEKAKEKAVRRAHDIGA